MREMQRVNIHETLRLPSPVPEQLLPGRAATRFPEITPELAQQVKSEGWTRLGVATVIIRPDGRALIIEHKLKKNKDGENLLGFLTETMKGTIDDQGHITAVESVTNTSCRVLHEELGFEPGDIPELQVSTYEHDAYQPLPWDDPKAQGKMLVFAVPLFVDGKTAAKIDAQLKKLEEQGGTEEVTRGKFLTWAEIGRNESLTQNPERWRQASLVTRAIHACINASEQAGVQKIPLILPAPDSSYTTDLIFKR